MAKLHEVYMSIRAEGSCQVMGNRGVVNVLGSRKELLIRRLLTEKEFSAVRGKQIISFGFANLGINFSNTAFPEGRKHFRIWKKNDEPSFYTFLYKLMRIFAK
jgi:hypothetical protein